MKTILTVQHTESEHHLNGHIGAWHDWALTEHGREQAFRIGKWLKEDNGGNLFRMYISPQFRAKQTAMEMNRSLGLEPEIREELREVNAGEGNGKPRVWYQTHAAPRGSEFDPDHRDFPDAESDRELWERLRPFYQEIMVNKEKNILVISHGTTLSFLQSMLIGQSVEDRGRFRFSGDSGSVSRFTVREDGSVTAVYVNRTVVQERN